jgi:riboflavin kinase/FMN adenylyltransferase
VRCIRRVVEIPRDLPAPRAAMGTFDGLHRGHRAVIDRVVGLKRSSGGCAVVVTFEPYPQDVLAPQRQMGRLTSLEEKKILLGPMDIEVLLALPFDRGMASMEAESFFRDILGPLGMKSLVVGYNFTVGRGRSGDLTTLTRVGNEEGFDVKIVSPVLFKAAPVSSTRIRGAVSRGDIATANDMLGYSYCLYGKVVGGEGRGKSLGYPTANLAFADEAKLLPGDGVYAVWVRRRDSRLPGVMNAGRRPTFGPGRGWVEVHLMDFRDDIYGEMLLVEVVDRLRGEKAFADEVQLREQMGRDVEAARQLLDGGKAIRDHR